MLLSLENNTKRAVQDRVSVDSDCCFFFWVTLILLRVSFVFFFNKVPAEGVGRGHAELKAKLLKSLKGWRQVELKEAS